MSEEETQQQADARESAEGAAAAGAQSGAAAEHPEVHADYANEPARAALDALLAAPDFELLAAFLNAAREGYLVVDVTGQPRGKQGPRVRATRSTTGKLVLPLYTSMRALREAAGVPEDAPAGQSRVQGAVMPARDALALIGGGRFVAAEFDKGPGALVVLRKYVVKALATDGAVTAADLEALR